MKAQTGLCPCSNKDGKTPQKSWVTGTYLSVTRILQFELYAQNSGVCFGFKVHPKKMRELKVPYVGFPPSATEVSGYCGSIRSHAATLNKDYQVTV